MTRVNLAVILAAPLFAASVLLPSTAAAAEKAPRKDREELSVPAKLTILRNKTNAHPMDRTKHAAALGQLTDPREVRDQQVVDALCKISNDAGDDLFVRMECMNALGDLQANVFADDYVRSQYAMSFVSTLKDAKEDELIRAKVTQVLGRTLPPDQPQTQHAVIAMVAIAEDRNASLLLRVTCVDALAQLGAASELVDLVSVVLSQNNLDPLLQERVIKAFGDVLSHAENLKPVPLPTLLKIKELTLNAATPIELRVVGLRALAVLKKAGLAKSLDLMPEIRRIIRESDDAALVVAAIEAAGILDEADVVVALVDAYKDFLDAEKPDRENDVKIRSQVVRTLAGLLNAQASKKRADAEAIRQTTELFMAIINPVQENKETGSIREEAMFALRYLYPKKPEFTRFHQPVIERLLAIAKEDPQAAKELPKTIADTLTILTRVPFKTLERWEKWYQITYKSVEVVRTENP